MITVQSGSLVTAVFSKQYDSPEHAAFECVDDEECLAVTCTSLSAPMHCRMVTRKAEAAGTTRIPYPQTNAKGFCMDRKLHREIILAPKRIRLTVPQRANGLAPMSEPRLNKWWVYIAGEFERMDDPDGLGLYYWGRPVYKRTTAAQIGDWDYIKWNSLKMHWELHKASWIECANGGTVSDCPTGTSGLRNDFYNARSAMASDAPIPTSGRWQVTAFNNAAYDGIEQIEVAVLDTTPPSVCGDGVLQAGEECDDGNLVPADGCSPVCKTDITDSSLRVITQHRSPSPPSRRRLSERLSTRLKDAITCLSTSKDSDGDGTPDCLDQCPYDPNAHAAKDCPITLDVVEQPVEERLIVTVDHAIATEVLLEVIFGQHQAIIGPVTATSRDEAGSHWSLSVHTPGWHKGDPFTVRAKTFTNGIPSTWSNGICSRRPPEDAGCVSI